MIHDILKENSRIALNTLLLKVKAVHTFQMLRTASQHKISHPKNQNPDTVLWRPQNWHRKLASYHLETKSAFGYPNLIKNYFVDWYPYTHKSLRFEILSLFCHHVNIHQFITGNSSRLL
jgi:hypothetical protein